MAVVPFIWPAFLKAQRPEAASSLFYSAFAQGAPPPAPQEPAAGGRAAALQATPRARSGTHARTSARRAGPGAGAARARPAASGMDAAAASAADMDVAGLVAAAVVQVLGAEVDPSAPLMDSGKYLSL